jgi:hypothetical protein
MAQSLISKSFRTPKGCHVRSVTLNSVKRQADVSYDCGEGGSGTFPLPEGPGFSNYRKALVKNVRAVSIAGSSVSGEHVGIGFISSPRHVKCNKTAGATELDCRVFSGDVQLAGARRRRRR